MWKHSSKFHTRDRLINICLVVKIYHTTAFNLNILPMYKRNFVKKPSQRLFKFCNETNLLFQGEDCHIP